MLNLALMPMFARHTLISPIEAILWRLLGGYGARRARRKLTSVGKRRRTPMLTLSLPLIQPLFCICLNCLQRRRDSRIAKSRVYAGKMMEKIMIDYTTSRRDRIEELTHDLHVAAAAEVTAELNADYRAEFGEEYVSAHPCHIAPDTFERLVIERMRKNAQPPKKANP